MFPYRHSRFATGLLVATALLGAACSDATSSDPASGITATPSFSRSSQHSGSGGSGAAAGFTVLGQAAASCTDGTIAGDVGTFQTTPPGAITLVRCPVTGGVRRGECGAPRALHPFCAR